MFARMHAHDFASQASKELPDLNSANAKKTVMITFSGSTLPTPNHCVLRAPDPVKQCSKKMTSLPALFCCTYFPGSVLY